MTETLTNLPTTESMRQPSEGYHMIAMLTSDVLREQEHVKLTQQIEGDPAVKRFSELEDQQNAATRQMYAHSREGRHEESQEIEAQVERLQQDMEKLPSEVRHQYHTLHGRLRALNGYRERRVSPNDIEAQKIQEIINNAPPLQPVHDGPPPFEGYMYNTDETWQHVPDSQIRQYLSERVFMDTQNVSISGVEQKNGSIAIESPRGETINVPLDLIVYAQGFDSWRGREGRASGKSVSSKYSPYYNSKSASLDVIKHYASLPSEIPSVSEINLYIQPDGTIFGDNGSGDSHRIAAAILRGDTTIKAERLTIQPINRNIIKPADTRGL